MTESRKNFRHGDSFQEKLNDLVAHGFANDSEVIRAAVLKLHRDTFVNSHETVNLTTVENTGGRDQKSEQEKGKAKRNRICKNDLNGEIKDGQCIYFNYFKREKYKQEMPLSSINKNNVKKQFDPSKEEVARLQDEGKVSYDLDDDPFYNERQD